jgi:hypothetical protein
METRGGAYLALLVVLAGCTIPIFGDAPPYPDRPDSLNDTNVREYVEDYEAAEVYRGLETNDELEFYCVSEILAETERGYVVRTRCSWDPKQGSGVPSSSTYFVNDSVTDRIRPAERVTPHESVYRSSNASENMENPGASILVYNFASTPRTVSLTATFADGPETETAYRNTTTLPAKTGLIHHDVTIRKGEYDLSLTTNGSTTHHSWVVRESTPTSDSDIGIVIPPDGELRTVNVSQLQIDYERSDAPTGTNADR